MKAILEFDLNEHFEKNAHIRATKATDAYLVIYEMYNWMKSKYKYEDKETVTVDELRRKLNETCENYNINIDLELD